MKEQISDLFYKCVEDASEEELSVLNRLLEGFNDKKELKDFHDKKQLEKGTYLGSLLDMKTEIGDDFCVLSVPISPLIHNSFGIVHGGITATIIDTAMGTLANSLLPEGYGAVTTQLNVHYLAVGQGEYLACKAKLDHKGTKTFVLSADVFREDGKKIAQASGSFFVIEKRGEK